VRDGLVIGVVDCRHDQALMVIEVAEGTWIDLDCEAGTDVRLVKSTCDLGGGFEKNCLELLELISWLGTSLIRTVKRSRRTRFMYSRITRDL
jgi:hypothetical protein